MKVNAGIVTTKLKESKDFYTSMLGFSVVFENEFYVLMQTPQQQESISFLLPNHPTQAPVFHKPFQGEGLFLTVEVEDVDSLYREIRTKRVDIQVELRDEPWGDRHFAIKDPNGITIDIVYFRR